MAENIPLKIFQTWHTKELPLKMKECVNMIKVQNPEFEHFIFDDTDCREFINNNFNREVVDAFDSLVPGTYKADLWRYCVLYMHGGIYLDIKFYCEDGFKLINLIKEEVFVFDRPGWSKPGHLTLHNGFICVKKNNKILLECIHNIVKNVKTNNYGYNCLYPTGPGLLGDIWVNYNLKTMTYPLEKNFKLSFTGDGYSLEGKTIIKQYEGYRDAQKTFQMTDRYYNLYDKQQIYKNNNKL